MCAPYFVNLNNNTFQLKMLLFFVHLRSQQKRTESHLQWSNLQCCHFDIVILRVAIISNVRETRVLAYRSFRSVNKCDMGARYRSKKRKKRNSEMWQVTYLPRPPALRYPQQSCRVGCGPGRNQPCQVSSKSVQEFWVPEGSKSAIFLYLALWLTG